MGKFDIEELENEWNKEKEEIEICPICGEDLDDEGCPFCDIEDRKYEDYSNLFDEEEKEAEETEAEEIEEEKD